MADLLITSATNPRLKSLLALRRRRTRDAERLTVVDGFEELALAVAAGHRPTALYHCPDLMAGTPEEQALVERVRHTGASVAQVSRAAFEKVAYREGPDGFLAVLPAPDRSLEDLAARLDAAPRSEAPLLLVCEGIEKPGNLGAMLRTADAAGATAVIAADPVTDWGNPNVVRASKGTVFSVPVLSATTGALTSWLAGRGIPMLAATPDTETLHTGADYRGPVAIAVGTEKWGLTDAALAAATTRIRIPMRGRANSLNVATSAAIILYEAVRQRSHP